MYELSKDRESESKVGRIELVVLPIPVSMLKFGISSGLRTGMLDCLLMEFGLSKDRRRDGMRERV